MADPDPDPTPPSPPDPTPPTPTDPPLVPPVPDPTPTPSSNSGDRLDKLEGLVTGLVEAVNKLIPGDEKPTRRPWTHIGSKDRD